MASAAAGLARPPQTNIDAERSILGTVLLDNTAISRAVKHISSGDFFLDSHKKLFRHMLEMSEKSEPIDLVTLSERLFQSGELDRIGVGDVTGAVYIASLADGMPRVSNVEHYAKIVREKSLLRQMGKIALKVSNDAQEPDADLAHLQKELRSLSLETTEPMKIVGGNGHLRYSARDFLTTEFPTPDHLVEGVTPRGGSTLLFALPHRLKSWWTTAMALGCTRAWQHEPECTDRSKCSCRLLLGTLEVRKPVRTLLVQVEDFPGQLQWRMRELLRSPEYKDVNLDFCSIIPRCNMDLMKPEWFQAVYREIEQFQAEHVIFDVMRRIFRGDINSPKESAQLLEQIDRLREPFNCAVTVVHHANKKDSEIMTGAAGSYNLAGWANVVMEFKRKTEEGGVTHVEIEVDNKLAPSPEPMRMVLNLTSQIPLRLEALEDGTGLTEALERLGAEWTVRDLADALDVHKANAQRRLKKWVAAGKVEKVAAGKRGRSGGLARWKKVDEEDYVPPVRTRRDVN